MKSGGVCTKWQGGAGVGGGGAGGRGEAGVEEGRELRQGKLLKTLLPSTKFRLTHSNSETKGQLLQPKLVKIISN